MSNFVRKITNVRCQNVLDNFVKKLYDIDIKAKKMHVLKKKIVDKIDSSKI